MDQPLEQPSQNKHLNLFYTSERIIYRRQCDARFPYHAQSPYPCASKIIHKRLGPEE
jgi:hypothetical protein